MSKECIQCSETERLTRMETILSRLDKALSGNGHEGIRDQVIRLDEQVQGMTNGNGESIRSQVIRLQEQMTGLTGGRRFWKQVFVSTLPMLIVAFVMWLLLVYRHVR